MIDPVLHHLPQAKQTAQWIAQMIQLDPDLVLPAALPLLAARLLGADSAEDEGDDESAEVELAVI